ncbi:MAG: hypothetical protein GTN38_04245 [Candidatus Aenigmarchaeota archaeon]|nr:hypothetical protein [Candidatus Aenigmarchaeota archaeon]NIP40873.1 hypothetical protein [Candidatus Aenigmarchaeota archaeon]NIQ17987.1 hypothetical protein [Candidatus Aenigmarchaeota archaeon]NIS73576.1 hypothetical protein [Candidatus Aenigmarchaeota archaeon]
MKRELYSLSRGELGRKVYGAEKWRKMEINSIKDPIQSLMKGVEGSELVMEEGGRSPVDDTYRAIFFVSPEAVCIDFNARISVHVYGFGTDLDRLRRAEEKIQGAFREPDSI